MPYVTDTHSLIWYITDDPKLSTVAKEFFKKWIIFRSIFSFLVLSSLNYYISQKRKRLMLTLICFLL